MHYCVSLYQLSSSEKRSISASFLSLLYGTETGTHGSAEVLRDLFCAAGAFDRAVVRRAVLGPSGVGVHIFLSHAAVYVRLRLLFPFFIEAWIWGNGNEETTAVGNPFADGLRDRLRHHARGWSDGHCGSVRVVFRRLYELRVVLEVPVILLLADASVVPLAAERLSRRTCGHSPGHPDSRDRDRQSQLHVADILLWNAHRQP